MPDVKIGVNADGKNVSKAITEITKSVNDLGKAVAAAGKVQFKPVDVQSATRDIAVLNKQFELAVKNSKALRDSLKNSGQSGRSIQDVDFNKLSVDPLAAQRMRDKAFGFSSRGTAWDMGNFAPVPGASPVQPGQSPVPSPRSTPSGSGFFSRVGRTFSGGMGGGVSSIANSAISGAGSGAEEGGGLGGGAMGLLKGAGIGAALYGVFKAGQAVSQGYDMAKDRGLSLDSLKRQMGDLGVSFAGLKMMTDVASQGLGVNSKEFAKLAEQYNQASHNADKTPGALGSSVQDATGFARAYGMDPGQSAQFFGGMKNLDTKSNNRDLALQIAEAVNKSGGRAMAGDVMQFIQTMAASSARASLSAPNTDAYAAAYGSMVSKSGITSDMAASMLGQANSAISGMGMAGEAGRNFQLGAINRYGNLGMVAASALSSGGMFATRNSVFGNPSDSLNKYLSDNGIDSKKFIGEHGDVTNWEALRGRFQSAYKDPLLRLDAVQRDLGLNSIQQAAAMMNLNGKQSSGLGAALARAHVQLKDVSESGIATLASIGGASSHDDLDKIYSGITGRTGSGALSSGERKTLDSAQGGNTEDFRDALLKVMAPKDQENTDSKSLRESTAHLESLQTYMGDKLIPLTDGINTGVGKLVDFFIGKHDTSKNTAPGGRGGGGTPGVVGAKSAPGGRGSGGHVGVVGAKLVVGGRGHGSGVAYDAQTMAESGGVNTDANGNLLASPKGALGIAQILPSTGANPGLGVTPLKNWSVDEALRLKRDYMGALMKRYGGDHNKSLAAYNWGMGHLDRDIAKNGNDWLAHAPQETQNYIKKINSAEQVADSNVNLKIDLTHTANDGKGGSTQHKIQATVVLPKSAGANSTVAVSQ